MRTKTVVAFLFGAILASIGSARHETTNLGEILRLSSLKSHCRLQKRWFGLVPAFPEAVWLVCGSEEFLVTGPNNLVDHVEIKTSDQAVEYVRFFTSSNSFRYFDMDGMVEIFPGESGKEFNVISSSLFKRHFHDAHVSELSPETQQESSRFGKHFSVSRTVVALDQRIYEVNEFVTENGFYDILSKKILFQDATKIGIVHLGDI